MGTDEQAIQATDSNAAPQAKDDTYCIVIGFDFSPYGMVALEGALTLARVAPKVMLHVLGVVDKRRGMGYVHGEVDMHAAELITEDMQEEVKTLLATRQEDGVDFRCHTRFGSSPAKEIIEFAAEVNSDAIVIGTHKRHGLDRLLHRPVAERVVREADCPVLVMRAKIDHSAEQAEFTPEPPCPDCVATREKSEGADQWCDAHRVAGDGPHTYKHRNIGGRRAGWSTYNF